MNKEQAINIIFATLELRIKQNKENLPDNTLKLIDEAKNYILTYLR